MKVGIKTLGDELLVKATKKYLNEIEELTPKALVAHFIIHIICFMKDSEIIHAQNIKLPNLTYYKIPTNQYNFSFNNKEPNDFSSIKNKMMESIDSITLEGNEYEELVGQCNKIYEYMTKIHDELFEIHPYQPKQIDYFPVTLNIIFICIAFITYNLSYDPQATPSYLMLD